MSVSLFIELGVIFCSGGMNPWSLQPLFKSFSDVEGKKWILIEFSGGLFLFGGVLMFFDRSLYVSVLYFRREAGGGRVERS